MTELIKNSTTFSQKTKFSQEKWIKKKKKRFAILYIVYYFYIINLYSPFCSAMLFGLSTSRATTFGVGKKIIMDNVSSPMSKLIVDPV